MKELKLGEDYYDTFNFVWQESPYYWAWKCIEIKSDGTPVFIRTNPAQKATKIEGKHFFDQLKTKDEVDADWEQERVRVERELQSKDGVINFMIEKIHELDSLNEYGYSFTTWEKVLFKQKLKEYFNKEIEI